MNATNKTENVVPAPAEKGGLIGAPKMKTYIVKGWVEVEVIAEIQASSLRDAHRKFKESGGNGLADGFNYAEGNWCSPVNLESITRKKAI